MMEKISLIVPSIGYDKHLEEYKKGRRTPIDAFK